MPELQPYPEAGTIFQLCDRRLYALAVSDDAKKVFMRIGDGNSEHLGILLDVLPTKQLRTALVMSLDRDGYTGGDDPLIWTSGRQRGSGLLMLPNAAGFARRPNLPGNGARDIVTLQEIGRIV